MFKRFALMLLGTTSLALFATANTGGGAPITIPLHKSCDLKRDDGTFHLANALRSVVATQNKVRRNLINLERNVGRDAFPEGAEIKRFATVESEFSEPLARRELGSEALSEAHIGNDRDIDRDIEWSGSISIGTPQQCFLVNFDTTNSDLWIPSTACITLDTCKSRHKYKASESKTSRPQNGTFQLDYGDGYIVKASLFTDTVNVAGIEVKNQFFGAATNVSKQFAPIPMDGILGLGFPELSMLQKPPFFQTAIAQKVISNPVFAFFLSDTASELHLGGVNKAHFKGDIENHSLSAKSKGFWQLAGGSISVGGHKVASGFETIIQTGGSLIYGQPGAVQKVYAKIPGAKPFDAVPGFYRFPCSSKPEVSFGWGGKQWNISAGNLNLGPTTNGSTTCIGALVGRDLGLGNTWLLGDALIRNAYTVFNVGSKTVGFAQLPIES